MIMKDLKKEKTYIMYHNYKPVVTNDDKYYPYECAFDFEAMLKTIKTKDEEKKLQIIYIHIKIFSTLFSPLFLHFFST